MLAMGTWGERWLELAPEHLDPGVVLNSWVSWFLARDLLPAHRVVVRFDFPDRPHKADQLGIIFDGDRSEICRTNPGYDEDLVVTSESLALSEWHLGRVEWADAVRSGRIRVAGPPRLGSALPTWNRRSGWARLDIQRERAQPN